MGRRRVSETPAAPASEPDKSVPARGLLWFSGSLLILWAAFIVYEIVVSANPTIVSRGQVLAAETLVRGRLESETRLVVSEVLWSEKGAKQADFPVKGVELDAGSDRRIGAEYYAALERRDGEFAVVPIPFEHAPPPGIDSRPIYPASETVRKQLESLRPKGN